MLNVLSEKFNYISPNKFQHPLWLDNLNLNDSLQKCTYFITGSHVGPSHVIILVIVLTNALGIGFAFQS